MIYWLSISSRPSNGPIVLSTWKNQISFAFPRTAANGWPPSYQWIMLQQVFLSFVGFWLLLPLVFCCIGWTKHGKKSHSPACQDKHKRAGWCNLDKVLKTRLAICLSSDIQIWILKRAPLFSNWGLDALIHWSRGERGHRQTATVSLAAEEHRPISLCLRSVQTVGRSYLTWCCSAAGPQERSWRALFLAEPKTTSKTGVSHPINESVGQKKKRLDDDRQIYSVFFCGRTFALLLSSHLSHPLGQRQQRHKQKPKRPRIRWMDPST